jgi:hypothetical protein
LHLNGCTTVINIAVLNIINDLGKVTLPVLYTLAGKCILKAPKRASNYYGVLSTMGNVLFYIIVLKFASQQNKNKARTAKVLYSILWRYSQGSGVTQPLGALRQSATFSPRMLHYKLTEFTTDVYTTAILTYKIIIIWLQNGLQSITLLRLCLQKILNTNNICILLTIYQNPYQYEVRTGKPGLHKKSSDFRVLHVNTTI